jgi:predicted ferric reductase
VTWGLLFFFLAVLSLYLVCSSVFALYIATLQNMTPVKALRSAKRLVQYRRWSIMRKIILLPIIFIVVATVIMLPVILFLSPAAPWIFFALTMLAIAVTHSYIYTLYRELL